jgi:hypothetical protein
VEGLWIDTAFRAGTTGWSRRCFALEKHQPGGKSLHALVSDCGSLGPWDGVLCSGWLPVPVAPSSQYYYYYYCHLPLARISKWLVGILYTVYSGLR